MKYGLLGEKLGHSYSVPIHRALGRYEYELCPMPETELKKLLARRDFLGANVTIPYKRAVLPFCDWLSDNVRETGSANTLVVRDGKLMAYNTDVDGFTAMIRRLGVDVAGKKAVVLGSGGASLAAHTALARLKAGQIVTVSRRGPVTYERLYADHGDAQILINATPVGMYPDTMVSPADLSRLPRLEAVLDMIYNPARTRLMMDAEAKGIPCANGLWMLVAQAMRAAEIFTGESVPKEKTAEIYGQVQRQGLNVVLVGMPGCGKTTVGRELARIMKREFADCDEEITRTYGKAPAEIILEQGQAAFRALETETLRGLCKRSSLVIATGGGAVTQPENRDILRQNGVILHIQRPIQLLDTGGRPLSRGGAALAQLEKERMPLYRAWADAEIQNDDLNAAVAAAKEAYCEAADR